MSTHFIFISIYDLHPCSARSLFSRAFSPLPMMPSYKTYFLPLQLGMHWPSFDFIRIPLSHTLTRRLDNLAKSYRNSKTLLVLHLQHENYQRRLPHEHDASPQITRRGRGRQLPAPPEIEARQPRQEGGEVLHEARERLPAQQKERAGPSIHKKS